MALPAVTDDRVNLLLVDDTPNNLIALAALLGDGPYRITTATSGYEALECLQANHDFAVILTDVMMPGMNGFEFAARVKLDPRLAAISIIFLTAKVAEVAEIFHAYEVGGVDYLQKPLEPEMVKAKVAVFAQLFRQRQMIEDQAHELVAAAQREQAYRVRDLKNKAAKERKRVRAFREVIATKEHTESLQSLQLRVTGILGGSAALGAVIPSLFALVGEGLSWDRARLWLPTKDGQSLDISSIWQRSPGPWDDDGARATHAFKSGEASWGQTTPAAVVDQGPAAPALWTQTVALPIRAENCLLGVVEFHAFKQRYLDAETRRVLMDISSRIGLFILRKNAEEDLRRVNEELERRVESRTRELQRSATQLRLITNCMPVLVAELDSKERFLFVNEAFEAIARAGHLTSEDLLGQSLEATLGEQDYAFIKPFIDRALSGDEAGFECELRTTEFKKATFSLVCIPEFDDERQVTGVVIVGMDITKHKKTEAALTLAKASADAANAAKSAFLANMSHEIRTPLGAVLGFSELVLSPQISEDERASYLAAMKRNGELLSNLINDILDLSKVEAGKLEVERREVALAELLNDTMTLLQLTAAGKGVALTLELDADVPAQIRTDALRLRQILLNIVGNAVKFTTKGSVSVRVCKSAGAEPKLKFVVIDTGPGITAEQTARLFEPFTQADASTKRLHGGTGLGLALSRHLARVLGGDLQLASSRPGSGSTFIITIDPGLVTAPEGKLAANRPSTDAPRDARIAHPLSGIRVLFADDAADNRMLVTRYLRMAGAKVETAADGCEVLAKVEADPDFHAILMDLQMPHMDGYEATAELRRKGYSGPIIALTAHALMEERTRCLEAGFDDHICKPIDSALLCDKLIFFTKVGAAVRQTQADVMVKPVCASVGNPDLAN